MSSIVFCSSVELSVSVARSLPRSSLATCWKGDVLPSSFAWSIAIDPELLWFVCSLPGGRACGSDQEHGAFIEGLWNGDVAELFIKGKDGRYQELNLSPSGAWWSMTLSEYRKRESSPRRPHLVHLLSTVGESCWEVVAAFQRRSLDVDLSASCRVHVTGMWYHPEPTFLSSRPPHGVEPDYHHAQCFEPVSLVDVPK